MDAFLYSCLQIQTITPTWFYVEHQGHTSWTLMRLVGVSTISLLIDVHELLPIIHTWKTCLKWRYTWRYKWGVQMLRENLRKILRVNLREFCVKFFGPFTIVNYDSKWSNKFHAEFTQVHTQDFTQHFTQVLTQVFMQGKKISHRILAHPPISLPHIPTYISVYIYL